MSSRNAFFLLIFWQKCVLFLDFWQRSFFFSSKARQRNVRQKSVFFAYFLSRNACFLLVLVEMRFFFSFPGQVRLYEVEISVFWLFWVEMHVFCLFLGRIACCLLPRLGDVMSSRNTTFSYFFFNAWFLLVFEQKYVFFACFWTEIRVFWLPGDVRLCQVEMRYFCMIWGRNAVFACFLLQKLNLVMSGRNVSFACIWGKYVFFLFPLFLGRNACLTSFGRKCMFFAFFSEMRIFCLFWVELRVFCFMSQIWLCQVKIRVFCLYLGKKCLFFLFPFFLGKNAFFSGLWENACFQLFLQKMRIFCLFWVELRVFCLKTSIW